MSHTPDEPNKINTISSQANQLQIRFLPRKIDMNGVHNERLITVWAEFLNNYRQLQIPAFSSTKP